MTPRFRKTKTNLFRTQQCLNTKQLNILKSCNIKCLNVNTVINSSLSEHSGQNCPLFGVIQQFVPYVTGYHMICTRKGLPYSRQLLLPPWPCPPFEHNLGNSKHFNLIVTPF